MFRDWDADRVREVFDAHPNITVLRLAQMTGATPHQIKAVLMDQTEDLYDARFKDYWNLNPMGFAVGR